MAITLRPPLIPYPLDLTARHLLPTAVVELGRARIGVADSFPIARA